MKNTLTIKIIFLQLVLLSSLAIQAQSISRQVLASMGGYDTKNNVSIDWTIGEVFSNTEQSAFHLTEGFQQGKLAIGGLVELSAKNLDNNTIQLEWGITKSIITTNYFLERRGEDQKEFENIGKFQNDKYHFLYDDKDLLQGKILYRVSYYEHKALKYSNIAVVSIKVKPIEFKSYPNPVINQLNVDFLGENIDDFTINIISQQGQLVHSNKYNRATSKVTIDIEKNMAKGTYFIEVVDNENNLIGAKKFIKL